MLIVRTMELRPVKEIFRMMAGDNMLGSMVIVTQLNLTMMIMFASNGKMLKKIANIQCVSQNAIVELKEYII